MSETTEQIGELWVNIFGGTTEYVKALDTALAVSENWVEKLGVVIGAGVETAFAAATAAVGISAILIINSYKEVSDEIEKTARAADRLGVGTEQLGALGYAAKQTGSSIEEVEIAITVLQRNLSNLGGRDSYKFDLLKRMGLDPASLRQMSADKQFEELSRAISKLPTPAERTAAAVALLGRSAGTALAPLLNDVEKLDKLMMEADMSGKLFSREDARKIEESQEAIKKLTSAFEGLKQELAIGVAPTVTKVADELTDMLKGFNMLLKFREVAKAGKEGGISAGAGEFINQFGRKEGNPNAGTGALGGIDKDAEKAKKLVSDAINEMQRDIDKFSLTPGEIRIEALTQKLDELGITLSDIDKKRLEDLDAILERQKEEAALEKQRIKDHEQMYKDLAQRAHKVLEDNLTPIQKLKEEVQDIDKLIKSGALDKSAGDAAKKRLVEAYAESLGKFAFPSAGAAVVAGTREAFHLTHTGSGQPPKSGIEKGILDLLDQTKASVVTEKEILKALEDKDPLLMVVSAP